MMVPGVDLYASLRKLLEQIPDDMVSTPRHLAAALGDTIAHRAVIESLKREGFRQLSKKVVVKPSTENGVFSNFTSDYPLKGLAKLQEEMARRVIMEDEPLDVGKIAGADVVYDGDKAYAGCVVMDRDSEIIDKGSAIGSVRFPYIAGYLMFREAPAVEAAVERVSEFDVLLINGHGIAHPRSCGLATCVGLELDVPTIGVAKRALVGKVGEQKGAWAPLLYKGRVIGAEIKREDHSSIYASVGHMISLESSVETVLTTLSNGLLPEPLAQAHIEAIRVKKGRFRAFSSSVEGVLLDHR